MEVKSSLDGLGDTEDATPAEVENLPVAKAERSPVPRDPVTGRVMGAGPGRPKGSKNKLTLIRQALDLALREQAAPKMAAVMNKALDLAIDGDRAMIKLLLELHMSKQAQNDEKAADKVEINITSAGPAPRSVTPTRAVIDVTDAEVIN